MPAISLLGLLLFTGAVSFQEQGPEDASTGAAAELFETARQAFQSGNFDQAREQLQEVLQKDSSHSAALYLLGSIYFFENDLERALDSLQKARELAPNEGRIHFRLYEVLQTLGQRDRALQSLQEAVLRDPRLKGWRDALASEYLRRSRHEDAIREYRDTLDLYPNSYETRLNLALVLFALKRQETFGEIKKAYQINASEANRYFYHLMARNMNPEGLAEFINEMKKQTAVDEDGTKAYLKLGDAYLELERYNLAYDSFSRYLQDYPDDFEARYRQALALTSAGRWKEVIELLGALYADGLRDERALFVLVDAYLEQNASDKAQQILDDFIKEDSPLKVHYLQGMVSLKSGNLDLALKSFQTVLEKDPSYLQAYYQLGEIYRRQKDLQKSREYLAKYQRLERLQDNRARVRQVSLPAGTVGVAYRKTIEAGGGSGISYEWGVASGTVPPGLTFGTESCSSLSGRGVLSGTPTQAGSFAFTAQVTDSRGNTDQMTFTVLIRAAP